MAGLAPPGALRSTRTRAKPTTAAGRIDRWQKKLLDLTLRNRLLNFPDSNKTIPFLCTDVAYLEDRLAQGAAIRVISLPEQNPLGERDAALYRDVHGRDILLIDDILESGRTLSFAKELMYERGARNVTIAVLLDKREKRRTDLEADYVGFECPDHFVVGYGMDVAYAFRELPFVGVVTGDAE